MIEAHKKMRLKNPEFDAILEILESVLKEFKVREKLI
jgi:hypothetical protein